MHPASVINEEAVANRLYRSLTNQEYWDTQANSARPDLKFEGDEHLDYLWDMLYESGLTDIEYLDDIARDDPKVTKAISLWSTQRAAKCRAEMFKIPVENDRVRAHRLIQCYPPELTSPLGIYWTHSYYNMIDPVAPWGREKNTRSTVPTLVIEAMIPTAAIDWETSCVALCDWYCGDSESELRIIAGHTIEPISIFNNANDEPYEIPDITWIT